MLDLKCFDAIGFKAPDFQEFNRYLDIARLKGLHPSSERGSYTYWAVGSGIEIWAALDKQGRPLNQNPHFQGHRCVEVRVLEMIDSASTLEGGLRVQTNPREEGAPHYPFLFNVPCWDLTRPLLKEKKATTQGPLIISVQLTAFADELECFDTPEAFYTAQEKQKLREQQELGVEPDNEPLDQALHFIPTGLIVGSGEKATPKAAFSGEVVHGHVVTNPITNQKTLCLGVKTLGMTLDVIADASIVKGRPKLYGVANGHFWLSGRITEEIEATNRRLHIK